MKYFYSPTWGYWETTSIPPQRILDTYPKDTISVSQRPSFLHRFEDGNWIEPTKTETYDYESKMVRMQRDSILQSKVDPLVSNPFRYNSLSDADKENLLAYRQALLDITLQDNFPYSVTWPEYPL